VAIVNGMPVGITHVSLEKPREVWLRATRTDPNYRRIGVATAITEKYLKFAKQKGAKVARLATQSNNVATQSV
jgi:ribosomal protein S18 acetylase RimI-like enzyme